MAGQRQKRTEELADQRWQRTLGRDLEPARPSDLIVPRPPPGLLKRTRDAWAEFWSGPMATSVTINHYAALRAYFQCLDEYARALTAYRKERIVAGSMGQPVRSPAADLAFRWLHQAREIGEGFGWTPRDSVRFGGELAAGLADVIDRINSSLERGGAEDEDAGEWVET